MGTPDRRNFMSLSLLAIVAGVVLLTPSAQATAPPCASTSAPACDGECAVGFSCTDIFGPPCQCVMTGMPCGTVAGPPVCLGQCLPGETCVDMSGVCTCVASGSSCGSEAVPACNGVCPNLIDTCQEFPPLSGTCACPTTGVDCGFIAAASACQGECPPGTACLHAGGSTCLCATPPPVPFLSPLGNSVLAALFALILGLGVRRRRS